MFGDISKGKLPFQTYVYSTVKKSGKTTVGALVGRWAAETWGNGYQEVYAVANDLEQSIGRTFRAIKTSIELDPDKDETWKVSLSQCANINGSIVRALACDYRGQAGANQTATIWSELWGYVKEASKRLWDEMTPVPTRPISIRFVETYAGFEGESDLLYSLYEQAVLKGKQLTVKDTLELTKFGLTEEEIRFAFKETHGDLDAPVPLYVNKSTRLFAYWDVGKKARRMPWQDENYYISQAASLRPSAFRRLHLNEWTSSVTNFIEPETWKSCRIQENIEFDEKEPVVIGIDASVTRDSTAVVGVSRHPKRRNEVVIRFYHIWTPKKGTKLDYGTTITPYIEDKLENYNVIEVTYDPYQLHHWANELRQEKVVWTSEFNQGVKRLKADAQLYDLIIQRRLHHDGSEKLEQHLTACAAKEYKDSNKLRIVKKEGRKPIDAIVALSMASYECLRLNL